ncbi:MAG TPA: hypothetical protein ENG71_04000 [Thermoplasmatales archaeon]|nr:hypothetical protein [Thermoplasmatales archaeon]
MKKWFVVLCLIAMISLPYSSAKNDSWIKITNPSPGLYFKGEEIFPLRSSVILIGSYSLKVKAEGSDNIIAVYFALYDVRNKDIVNNHWDMEKSDGWNWDTELKRGIYALMVAGAAIDFEEPVAIDWLFVVVI